MKIRKSWKIALDAVMAVLLVLMYKKSALGMTFHEIGGLALIGLFVTHHLFNGKWIASVTSRLFMKTTPAKARVQYAVDALLLIAFVLIGLSGAIISKVVFRLGIAGGGWKILHYFCAALAVILAGVHIGLHASYLFGVLLRKRAAKAVAIVLTAALLVFGVYSMTNTSFLRWLTMPFSASQMQERAKGDAPTDLSISGGEAPELPIGGGNGPQDGTGKGATGGMGQGRHAGEGAGAGKGQHGGRSGAGLGAALLALAQYLSITAVFAAVTAGVERLIRFYSTRLYRNAAKL